MLGLVPLQQRVESGGAEKRNVAVRHHNRSVELADGVQRNPNGVARTIRPGLNDGFRGRIDLGKVRLDAVAAMPDDDDQVLGVKSSRRG